MKILCILSEPMQVYRLIVSLFRFWLLSLLGHQHVSFRGIVRVLTGRDPVLDYRM